MSMSALLSALRGAGRQHLTASTVAVRQGITGSHVFRIQAYTQVRETVPTGTAITSTWFHVGGHHWRIKCYPNGHDEETGGQYTSLLLENLCGSATARYNVSVLDCAGRPSYTMNSKIRLFEGSNFWGWEEFMKNDELEEGKHLVDDDLTLLWDVTVNPGTSAAVPEPEPEPTAAAEAAPTLSCKSV